MHDLRVLTRTTCTQVHNSAYLSLVAFDQNAERIRDVLFRMALSQDTASGPLFYALLALSSLCRDGVQQQALELKVASLTALSAASQAASLTPVDAAHHLAACMLLASFEVCQVIIWGRLYVLHEAKRIHSDTASTREFRRVGLAHMRSEGHRRRDKPRGIQT